jgi:hypothetical protein
METKYRVVTNCGMPTSYLDALTKVLSARMFRVVMSSARYTVGETGQSSIG